MLGFLEVLTFATSLSSRDSVELINELLNIVFAAVVLAIVSKIYQLNLDLLDGELKDATGCCYCFTSASLIGLD